MEDDVVDVSVWKEAAKHRNRQEDERGADDVRIGCRDRERGRDQVEALASIGATRVVHAARYADAGAFVRNADRLARLRAAVTG